jgi:hypothetical protein
VSVFESINNGVIKLSPVEAPYAKLVNEAGKCISAIKSIVANPYLSVAGKQALVPVSEAQSMNHESVKLTLADTSVWADRNGEKVAKRAYTVVNDFVFSNYENAFVYHLIRLLIARLRMIKVKSALDFPDKSSSTYVELNDTVDTYIRKLTRLSNEKVFVDNNRREIDMSNIFVTNILASDRRYNYCYKFFVDNFKARKAGGSVSKDFRVLYHNFALVQILYNLYKAGYSFDGVEYYVSVSGKIFMDNITLNGEKEIEISQKLNGIELSCNGKIVSVEFSKTLFKDNLAIKNDYNKKNLVSSEGKFVAYLSSDDFEADGILSIGYKNAEKTINKLISSL